MNPEEITVGETYNVRVRVSLIEPNRFVCRPLNQDGTPSAFCPNYFNFAEAEAFYPVDGIKSAKNAQKYDPCRKFKKGDKVRVKKYNGREPIPLNDIEEDDFPSDWQTEIYTVRDDERHDDCVCVLKHDNPLFRHIVIHPANLELITPVEELERYVVIHNDYEKYYEVCWKDDDEPDGRTGRTRCLTTFWYHNPPKTHTQKHAKAAAEAECDRLNAEHRKEQK